MPSLNAIDHVHIYVRDRSVAQKRHAEALGFTPVQAVFFLAENNGPLTLENSGGNIHLDLFERESFQPGSTGEHSLLLAQTETCAALYDDGYSNELPKENLPLRLSANAIVRYSIFTHACAVFSSHIT